MIEVGLWRASIGRFHLACVAKHFLNRLCAQPVYGDSSEISVSDVCITWGCLVFLANIVCCFKDVAESAFSAPFPPLGTVTYNSSTVTGHLSVPSDDLVHLSPMAVTFPHVQHAPSLCLAVIAFAIRRLRLSNDVEENPGPAVSGSSESSGGGAESTAVADSIKHLEQSLQQKLDVVLATMQTQADILKRQEDMLRKQETLMKKFGDEQETMKKSLKKNEQSISNLSSQQDDLYRVVTSLEAEVDRLEGFSRRNNVKFFGIPEEVGDTDADCVVAVKNVLDTYIPQKQWEPDVIERAHRLGKPNPKNPNPRPIIAKFQRWGDAMRLMKDREARSDMEHDNLRAAQDLTRRQTQKLKQLREEGKTAYYTNGKLRFHDNPRNNDDRRADNRRPGGPGLLTNTDSETPPDHEQRQPISEVEIERDVSDTQGHSRDTEENSGRNSGQSDARDKRVTRSANRQGHKDMTLGGDSGGGGYSAYIRNVRGTPTRAGNSE